MFRTKLLPQGNQQGLSQLPTSSLQPKQHSWAHTSLLGTHTPGSFAEYSPKKRKKRQFLRINLDKYFIQIYFQKLVFMERRVQSGQHYPTVPPAWSVPPSISSHSPQDPPGDRPAAWSGLLSVGLLLICTPSILFLNHLIFFIINNFKFNYIYKNIVIFLIENKHIIYLRIYLMKLI